MSTEPEDGSNKPAFFTLMIRDSINSVTIPKAFMRYIYNRNVPQVLLLKPEKGKVARVEIEKRGRSWSFTKGWTKFVEEQRLQHGDLLHFTMIESSFEVAILGTSSKDGERRAKQVGESSRAKKQKESVAPEVQQAPSFLATMTCYNRYELCVGKKFAEATSLKERDVVVLKDLKGDEWDAKVRLEKLAQGGERLRFASGWVEFYKDNMLKPGDKVLFQIIPGTGNKIHVQIISRA